MVRVQPPARTPHNPARSTPHTPAGQHAANHVASPVVVCPFTVVADLRERAAGWRFLGQTAVKNKTTCQLLVPLEHRHMVTADYAIDGHACYIERKSHDDAIGSIGGGHTNFRKEHERMRQIVESGGFCCVVIESSLDSILTELEDEFSARQLNPETVLSVVASWPQRYGVPWYFAGSREAAERLSLRILWKYWDRKHEGVAKE